MSASSCCVTCGTLTQLACSRGPEIFWMRDSGSVSTRPYFAKSTVGTAGSAPPRGAAALHDLLDERLDVVGRDAAFRARAAHAAEIDAELARELAHGRARMRFAERRRRRATRRCAPAPRARRGRLSRLAGAARRGRGVAAGCRLGARSRRAAARAARLQHEQRIAGRDLAADGDLELEHAAGLRRRHVHARLLGLERHEPLLGRDVVAGLHENVDDLDVAKSPRSGTHDGCAAPAAAAGAAARAASFGCRTVRSSSGRASTARLLRRRRARAGCSSVAITLPADTRSPTLTLSAVILPAAGDGMSIVALSVSSVMSPCSAATRVAGLDEHLDDLDVGKVTKIGYDDFHG